MASPHPNQALFNNTPVPPIAAVCDHYAGSERLLRKSLELQASTGPLFDVTVDLEDGAGLGQETHLRELAVELIGSPQNRFNQVGLRIHDPQSGLWEEDLQATVPRIGSRLCHITVPKVSSLQECSAVLSFIEEIRRNASIVRPIPVHVLIETHGALRDVWEIAQLPPIRGLDLGLMDFVSEHQGMIPASAMRSPEQFTHALVVRAKAEICAAAAAHGKIAVHNVTTEYDNQQLTETDARTARRQFGFTRMWSIHPAQIQPIVRAMAPDPEEITLACEVTLAGWKAQWAPLAHAGRLHDRASYRYFWSVLRRARSLGMGLPPEVETAFFANS